MRDLISDASESAPEFRLVDPKSVIAEHTLEAGPVDEALSESVRELGVLAPPLAIERADGTLVLVTGRQRLAAAVEAATMLPVRILRCSLAEAVRAAVDEHYLHRSTRSTIERGWDAYTLQQAEIARGRSGSVRSVARTISVAVGTAQYLLTIGRELTPERVSLLADRSGVPAARILTLTVNDALRLAATPEADRPAMLRQTLDQPDSGSHDPISWPIRMLRRVIERLGKLLRALLGVIRARVG